MLVKRSERSYIIAPLFRFKKSETIEDSAQFRSASIVRLEAPFLNKT